MEENLVGTDSSAYSYPHMLQKLKEHFGENIILAEINGKPNVLTFVNKAKAILHDFYNHRDLDTEKEKQRIIETAAKLIRNDIDEVRTPQTVYPSFDQLGSEESINFLPASLRLFLTGLITGKQFHNKIASIGQAIMQAARPRALLAPLQIGLGVQLYYQYASYFLIDTLHQHGFCCSYNEVHQFECNAVLNYGTDKARSPISRVKVNSDEIVSVGRVPILYCKENAVGMTTVRYQKFRSLAQLDLLWKTSVMFGSPRPAWSGMMQLRYTSRQIICDVPTNARY